MKVTPGTALDADGTLPVRVDVTERERHFVGFGASYSTNDGAGATAYWGDRNLFGNGERLRFDATVSGVGEQGGGALDQETDYQVSSAFRKPDFLDRHQDFPRRPHDQRRARPGHFRQESPPPPISASSAR